MTNTSNFTLLRYIKKRSVSQWEYVRYRYVSQICFYTLLACTVRITNPRGYQFQFRSLTPNKQVLLLSASNGSYVNMIITRYFRKIEVSRYENNRQAICTKD